MACMQVGKARALGELGAPYGEAAALLVSEALRGDPEHEGALLEYVVVVLGRGLVADALRILLRLLVRSHGNARVRCAGLAWALLLQRSCSELQGNGS